MALLGVLYYRYKSEISLANHRLAMQLQAEVYIPRVVRWIQGDDLLFPKDPAYKSAFFMDSEVVAGELDLHFVDLRPDIHKEKNIVYLVINMGSYGLKNGVVILQTIDDKLWLKEYLKTASLLGGVLFLLLFSLGVWLSRLFLRPMRDVVKMLDDFIKDTTHELNTPVTTILTNVELINRDDLDQKSAKKLDRIRVASRAIETLYDDLTYLLLGKKIVRKDEVLHIEEMILERCEYFGIHIQMKRLKIRLDNRANLVVLMDKKRAQRVIDNLLNNAIKYADRGSIITIKIDKSSLSIHNTGATIQPEQLKQIFRRYVRADESKGGFGIGLHIVNTIAQHYGIKIDVASDSDGTEFVLHFESITTNPQESNFT